MLKGNKGEWSEIYVLLKLLADGKIYSGDEHLQKNKDLFFPIQRILRPEKKMVTEFHIEEHEISIILEKEILKVPKLVFGQKSSELFKKIIESTGIFELPDIEVFLHSIKCYSLKAKSNDKTDIKILIHDLRTGLQHLLGFSIKSQMGSASTLFNSNKNGTNFKYELKGLNKKDIKKINETKRFFEKFEILRELSVDVTFVKVKSNVFFNNLVYIDSSLPSILGKLVFLYYSSNKSKIVELAKSLKEENPERFDLSSGQDFYAHKLKRFLTDVALGFTPGRVWNGKYDATGGYLIVKKDGEVICYHFYDKMQFEDYLFYNTLLDTPDPARHEFGKIYQEDQKFFIDLNLQVRFSK